MNCLLIGMSVQFRDTHTHSWLLFVNLYLPSKWVKWCLCPYMKQQKPTCTTCATHTVHYIVYVCLRKRVKEAMCTLSIQLYKWQVKWRGKWKLKTHLCYAWSVCYTWIHPTHTATWCSSNCEWFSIFFFFLSFLFSNTYTPSFALCLSHLNLRFLNNKQKKSLSILYIANNH